MHRPISRLLFVGAVLFATEPVSAQQDVPHPRYVGSEACADCHTDQMQAWQDSHHAWAWNKPSKKTVLGDFDAASIEHKGVTTRFSVRDGRHFVETDGPDGSLQEYEVEYTTGVEPLQQYLLETEPGRLQALDLAWDDQRGRWYHLYPDQDLKGGDGLHWTGPYKTWNARCAECHATGFEKNYDPRTRSYASRQSEIGVGCEACHGPGEAHVAWARAPGSYDPTRWPDLTAQGLTIGLTGATAEAEIQQCAGCHARREPLGDDSPLPGTAFHDAYRLALLRDGLYHADGSILDEVYVYGSFLQSKMYEQGVRCTDCHEPHAATLKADGNAICTQCHSPAGNPRFQSLRKAAYDDPAHHFHESGSDSAQCASCHMIERVYMGIDGRRDHSFRIPRPDLSDETGAPNACNDCHADRDAAWAAAEIERRFPSSERRGPHFSQVFAAARSDPTTASAEILAIAEHDGLPGIVRASALDLLRGIADETIAGRAEPLIGDVDPLVRAAAVALQRGAPLLDRLRRLSPALDDPRRAVRIAAARELLGAPMRQMPPRTAQALRSASGEWRASLTAKADYPESHMAIGGTALVLRNTRAAEQAFREAVRQDPQLVDAWVMLVRLRLAAGDVPGAADVMDGALALNPGNGALQAMREQLGGGSRP